MIALSDKRPGIEALKLSQAIMPLLVGRGPDVQAAALADLVSLLIVGYHPMLRDEVLNKFIAVVKELIPISENEIFGKAGHPGRKDLS